MRLMRLTRRLFLRRSSMEIDDFLFSIKDYEEHTNKKVNRERIISDFLKFKIDDLEDIEDYILK